ncbi:hypothetical protein VINI7043_12846 [Vibrio nigripulchritudo ATCC 27043]|nr:hypothetical protein VINI7043_12846 [Vibrio nigripulchritudo ATCC 27043]
MKKLFIALLAAVSLTITGHVSAEKNTHSFSNQAIRLVTLLLKSRKPGPSP